MSDRIGRTFWGLTGLDAKICLTVVAVGTWRRSSKTGMDSLKHAKLARAVLEMAWVSADETMASRSSSGNGWAKGTTLYNRMSLGDQSSSTGNTGRGFSPLHLPICVECHRQGTTAAGGGGRVHREAEDGRTDCQTQVA